jgi:hypothetical protein
VPIILALNVVIAVVRNHASAARVIAAIANMTLLLKPPSYKQILDMDEFVRSLATPGRRAATPAAIPLPLMRTCYQSSNR